MNVQNFQHMIVALEWAGLPGIWGRKSPEEVGKVPKSRQLHNRSESPKSRHHLRQKNSDDLKKKKVRRSGQVSKSSYTFSIIIDFQTIDNR